MVRPDFFIPGHSLFSWLIQAGLHAHQDILKRQIFSFSAITDAAWLTYARYGRKLT